jgi:hypothetical protein
MATDIPTPSCLRDTESLTGVPFKRRDVVRTYLHSRMPQDEARGREMAATYGLDYDGIRRMWGVEPVSIEIEVDGKLVRL